MRSTAVKTSAWRRKSARFSVPDGAAVMHELDLLTLLDIAEGGCRVKVPKECVYAPGSRSEFRLILKSDRSIERKVHTVCRWVSADEAGFEFEFEPESASEDDVSRLISRHLVDALRKGGVRVISGAELA